MKAESIIRLEEQVKVLVFEVQQLRRRLEDKKIVFQAGSDNSGVVGGSYQRKTMKASLLIIAILAVTGCTSVEKDPKTGAIKYRNGIFNKSFSELEYGGRSTNGVSKNIREGEGYQSDATAIVKAATEGLFLVRLRA